MDPINQKQRHKESRRHLREAEVNSAHLLSPRLSEYYDPRYFEKMADGFESPYPCCPWGIMNQLETREAEEVARKPITVTRVEFGHRGRTIHLPSTDLLSGGRGGSRSKSRFVAHRKTI